MRPQPESSNQQWSLLHCWFDCHFWSKEVWRGRGQVQTTPLTEDWENPLQTRDHNWLSSGTSSGKYCWRCTELNGIAERAKEANCIHSWSNPAAIGAEMQRWAEMPLVCSKVEVDHFLHNNLSYIDREQELGPLRALFDTPSPTAPFNIFEPTRMPRR